MGNKQANKSKKFSQDVIDIEKIKELLAGGDVDVTRKIIHSLNAPKKGENILDKLLEWKDNQVVLGAAVDSTLNFLDGLSSILEASKKITDAIQIAGIAFAFVSTVVDLIKDLEKLTLR